MSRYVLSLLVGLLAMLPLAAASSAPGSDIYSMQQVNAMERSLAVRSAVQSFEHAVSEENTQALIAAMEQIGGSYTPLERAYLRYTALMAFATLPDSQEGRSLLESVIDAGQAQAPPVKVWWEDAGHRSLAFAYDPVAAARFSLGRWNASAWQALAESELAGGRHEFLERWVSAQREAGGRLAASGLVAALQSAAPESLTGLVEPLRSYLRVGEPVGELAGVVAIRLGDVGLAQSILRDAAAPQALAFLAATRSFSDQTRLDLLQLAAGRDQLGSAAMYGLADLGTPESFSLLFSHLGSAQGNSAAAALAQQPSADRLQRLADVIRNDVSELAGRRAILSLHLARHHGGDEQLRQLASEPSLRPPLRRLLTRALP